jgi:hypothetical protein
MSGLPSANQPVLSSREYGTPAAAAGQWTTCGRPRTGPWSPPDGDHPEAKAILSVRGRPAVEAGRGIEQVHRSAATSTASVDLAEHLRQHRPHRHAARQRLSVFPIRGHDRVGRLERLHRPDRDGLFADVQVEEAADLGGAVELNASFLEPPDPQHLAEELARVTRVHRGKASFLVYGHHELSRVETSPSGSPSSWALRSRRTIFPLRVLGRASLNSISLGATTAPRRVRADAISCLRSSSLGVDERGGRCGCACPRA